MIKLKWAPIETWPGEPTKNRQSSLFKATYTKTLDLLEVELRHLRAKDAILQARVTWEQINNAGWVKSGVKPTGPELILTFDSPEGPLSFPCDKYFGWQANLRAIALSLEALRVVDRYGVTRSAEQYKGWRQIAAPAANFTTAETAAAFIVSVSGSSWHPAQVILDHETRKRAYRGAAAKCRPDIAPGKHEEFVKLQEAMALLDAVGKSDE